MEEIKEYTETDLQNARNSGIKEATNNNNFMSREAQLKFQCMDNKIDGIEKDICEIKETLKNQPDKKDLIIMTEKSELMAERAAAKVLETADKKYADKKDVQLIQKIVFGFLIILILGALGVIGWLIKDHLGISV